jgi:hypothetical protein
MRNTKQAVTVDPEMRAYISQRFCVADQMALVELKLEPPLYDRVRQAATSSALTDTHSTDTSTRS